MQALYNNLEVKQSLDPDSYSSNTDAQNSVDTKNWVGDAVVVVSIGDVDGSDNAETYTIKIEESSDDASWSDVRSVSIARDDDNSVKVEELQQIATDRNRYLRVSIETGGTSPKADVGATILGRNRQEPVR